MELKTTMYHYLLFHAKTVPKLQPLSSALVLQNFYGENFKDTSSLLGATEYTLVDYVFNLLTNPNLPALNNPTNLY